MYPLPFASSAGVVRAGTRNLNISACDAIATGIIPAGIDQDGEMQTSAPTVLHLDKMGMGNSSRAGVSDAIATG